MEKWGKGYSQNADNNESHNVRISGEKTSPTCKKKCADVAACVIRGNYQKEQIGHLSTTDELLHVTLWQ